MYYSHYVHSGLPYYHELINYDPFMLEERVPRSRIRRELDRGRSGHYYRMTLASFGNRPRVVQLLSMDRDGIVSMRVYRRRQGRWVRHKEYHRDIYDINYIGRYYNVDDNHYDHHDDYDHSRQPEFSKYVGGFVTATVDGLLSEQTRLFIHESSINHEGIEIVTIVYPEDADDARGANVATVNADCISVILSIE
ncbi:hypothetical protein ACU3L3_13630 [Priestia endophytica]|jgi:hypothetical protein